MQAYCWHMHTPARLQGRPGQGLCIANVSVLQNKVCDFHFYRKNLNVRFPLKSQISPQRAPLPSRLKSEGLISGSMSCAHPAPSAPWAVPTPSLRLPPLPHALSGPTSLTASVGTFGQGSSPDTDDSQQSEIGLLAKPASHRQLLGTPWTHTIALGNSEIESFPNILNFSSECG